MDPRPVEYYENLFLTSSLEELVQHYSVIESELAEDLILIATRCLEEGGAQARGPNFEIEGALYAFSTSYGGRARTFTASLIRTPTQPGDRVRERSTTLRRCFGRFRRVIIHCSTGVEAYAAAVARRLTGELDKIYTALAVSIRTKVLELSDLLVTNIYELLDIALLNAAHDEVVGHYWLNVSQLDSRPHGHARFTFMFSRPYIHRAVESLSRSSDEVLSPVDMLFALLFADAPDTGVQEHLGVRSGRQDTDLRQLKVFDANPALWHAELSLFGTMEVSYRYLHECRGYALCLNAPSAVFSTIDETAEGRRRAIEEQFQLNVGDVRRRFGAIRGGVGKHRSRLWDEIKDVATTIAAKTFSEMARP